MDSSRGSRRRFLRVFGIAAGGVLAGGVLQACGSLSPTAPQVTSGPNAVPTKAAALPRLTVSYGSPVGSFAALWMAKAIGAFEKYGVVVDIQYIETASAVPAMIANNIDAQEVSAAPILTADANGDLDLVIIGSALNHPILGLYAVPDITSAEQLRGRTVATDKPGTPTDYAARLSLSRLGLAPTDVDLRIVGSAAEVTPAMLSGQVPAGVVAPPQSFQLEAKGFRLLQSIFDQPYQNVGVIARRSRMDELAPALRLLLASIRDGIQAWNAQPDLAMRVIDEYAKVSDADILRKTYDFYTKTAPFEPSLQPTMPGIKAMMEFLSTSVPKLANYTPEQFVDTRLLSQLPPSQAAPTY
jgi:ABC-type nitrate/sulfonate/bicarbonate transport system substrate-binding protein